MTNLLAADSGNSIIDYSIRHYSSSDCHLAAKYSINSFEINATDTLGSSQSGGRCSGGSAGSAAVRHPPHYLRQLPQQQQQQQQQLHPLHRPRSLTDLLWDIRWSKSPPKIQLHPTVVADVIPPASSAPPPPRKYDVRRRSVSNLFSGSSSKKHTVFYRL